MENGHIQIRDLDRQAAVHMLAKTDAERVGLSNRAAIRVANYGATLVARGRSAASAMLATRAYARRLAGAA